jgi:hypothetical protein
MNTSRKLLICLQLVVLLLMVGGMAPASAGSPIPENKVHGRVGITARRLTHDLKRQGYEVARDCADPTLTDLIAGSYCYSIGDDRFPDDCNPADSTCDGLGLSLRTYLLPNSQRGPAPVLTLNSLVIPLQRPHETE